MPSTSSLPKQSRSEGSVETMVTCGYGISMRATASQRVLFGSHVYGGATSQRRSWESGDPRSLTCEATRSQKRGGNGMTWQVRTRVIEANLAAFSAQPKREFLPPRAPGHRKTRQQKINELLETLASMEHAVKSRSSKREICRCARCSRAGSLQSWKLEPTTCTAILARHDDRRAEAPTI